MPDNSRPGSNWGGADTPVNAATGGGAVSGTSGAGTVVVKGFGDVVAGKLMPTASQRIGDIQYVQGKSTYDDLKFADSGSLRNAFVIMNANNDPRIKQFMNMLGTDNVNVAREVWNDAASYATTLASQGKEVDFFEALGSKDFLDNYLRLPASLTGGGAAGPTTTVSYQSTEWTPQTLRSTANLIYQQALGRDVTDKELKFLAKKLNVAEAANPSKQVSTSTPSGSGSTVTQQYSGGVNQKQFLLQKARQLPEYAAYQQATTYFDAMMGALGGTVGGGV